MVRVCSKEEAFNLFCSQLLQPAESCLPFYVYFVLIVLLLSSGSDVPRVSWSQSLLRRWTASLSHNLQGVIKTFREGQLRIPAVCSGLSRGSLGAVLLEEGIHDS